MRPTQLKQFIIANFKANIQRPIHIEGSPGIGKTQIVGQSSKEIDIGFIHLHAPLMQTEDFGFPVINASRDNVSFIVSQDKFPVTCSKHPEKGILLVDELPQCDNSQQKIFANLMQEREIHGQRIKDGWLIVSTGNRASDRAGANRVLSHLRNKITTVELEVSLDDWTNWALDNGVKPEVIAFIRMRPELLNSFDPQLDINPTPRAWVQGVSARLGVIPADLEFQSFKGDVGEGAAAEITGFLAMYRKMISPDLIMLNPTTAPVPTDPNVLYALTMALVPRTTSDNFDAVMSYVGRMQPADFTVLFVKELTRRFPAIQESATFTRWACGPGVKLMT